MELNENGQLLCECCGEIIDNDLIGMAIKRKNKDTLYFCVKCTNERVLYPKKQVKK